MAWRRPGDKPLSEPMMVRFQTHICVTWPQWVKWWSDGKSRRAWELGTVCCNNLATTGLTPLWHEIPGACELLAEDRIAMKSPVWGVSHLHFVRWGSRKNLGTIWLAAVWCGWPVLRANLCLLCFQRLPVSERGSQYQQQFFSLIFKI